MLGFVSVVQTVDTKGVRWLSSPHEMMKRNDGGVPAAADHVGPPSPSFNRTTVVEEWR